MLQTEEALGSAALAQLETSFSDWYAWTLDLPGPYFLEAVEKLYKRNELAAGSFVALGRRIDLATVKTPIFLLAARDDELVAPAQMFAAERLVGTPARSLAKAIVPGRHLGLFMGKKSSVTRGRKSSSGSANLGLSPHQSHTCTRRKT